MSSNALQNHILFTNEDSGRVYLIPNTMKPKMEKWRDDFGSNGKHEDDHEEKMQKYLVSSDDSVALIITELQDLRKKLTPKKPLRKKAR